MRLRVGVILVAILALAAAPTFAQVTGAVKAGPTFSKTVIEEDGQDFDTGNKTGFVGGVAVDVPITELFSFQPEFLYVMKGGKNGDLTEGATDIDATLKVGMFQIPLLFKANFAGGSARPFVVFGPAVGFVTSAKFKVEGAGIEDEEDIKDDVEKVEFSGVVGVGVQFGRGTIEYRYDHGFNDLDEADTSSTAKSRTHAVLFGFRFGGN